MGPRWGGLTKQRYLLWGTCWVEQPFWGGGLRGGRVEQPRAPKAAWAQGMPTHASEKEYVRVFDASIF